MTEHVVFRDCETEAFGRTLVDEPNVNQSDSQPTHTQHFNQPPTHYAMPPKKTASKKKTAEGGKRKSKKARTGCGPGA